MRTTGTMRMLRALQYWVFLGVILLVLCGGSLFMDGSGQVMAQVKNIENLSAAEKTELVDQLQAGNGAFDQGYYDAALSRYDAAMAIAWLPEIFYRRGLCLEKLDRYQDAVLSYRRFLELEPDAKEKGRILADIERLESRLTTSATGQLKLETKPAATTVWIKGSKDKASKKLGVSPLSAALPRGKYTLEVKKEGYTTSVHEVTIQGGKTFSLRSVLSRSNRTRLFVETRPPGAVVRLDGRADGRYLGVTPMEVEVEAGRGQLHLSLEGYPEKIERFSIKENETLRLRYTLAPEVVGGGEPSGGVDGLGLGLTIAGGVMALGAGGLWWLTESSIEEANDYDRTAPGNSRAGLDDLEDPIPLYKIGTYVVGGVAAASLVTGVVLMATGGDSPPPGSVGIVPTDGGAHVHVGYTFE